MSLKRALTISAVLLFVFTGCLDSPTDSDNKTTSNTTPTTAVKNPTKSKDTKSILETDTITYEFSGVAGYSYVPKITTPSEDYYMNSFFVNTRGETLNVSALKVDSSGTYKLKVHVNSVSPGVTGPFTYTLSIKTVMPVSSNFNGKWILVKEVGDAFGVQSEINYSISNASEVIGIQNDTIKDYRYDKYSNSIMYEEQLFAQNYLSDYRYSISGNRLTFQSSNIYGSTTLYYEKYSGDLNAIVWNSNSFTAPQELLGSWYLSYEKWNEALLYDGPLELDSVDTSYSSALNSNLIIEIDSDTISYYRNNGGTFNKESYHVSEYYEMLTTSTLNGNSFGSKEANCGVWKEHGEERFEVYGDVSTFTRYNGVVPPIN